MKVILLAASIMAASVLMVSAAPTVADVRWAAANSMHAQTIGQILRQNRRWGNRNNRGARTWYETRNVRKGNKEYRDTFRITEQRDGKIKEKRVSHVRIR